MITTTRTACAPRHIANDAGDYALVRNAPPPARPVTEAFHAAQADANAQARERASFRATKRAFTEQARLERRRQFAWLAVALAFFLVTAALYLQAADNVVRP
jgi:hypothetical protein